MQRKQRRAALRIASAAIVAATVVAFGASAFLHAARGSAAVGAIRGAAARSERDPLTTALARAAVWLDAATTPTGVVFWPFGGAVCRPPAH